MATTNGTVPTELGQYGLPIASGQIFDEWLPELKGQRGRRVRREMADNEPIIAASLLVYEMLIRNASRDVEAPKGSGTEGQRYAEWLYGALYEDLSHPFAEFLSEVLSMLIWGYSWHVPTFKIRAGYHRDPERSSKFTDYTYGWAEWPIRAQETQESWVFDDRGRVTDFVQRIPFTGEMVEIPLEVSALFRMRQHKGSPEGRDLVRACHKPWYNKKHTEVMQQIGLSRSLAGVPMVKVPPNILSQKAVGDDLAMRQTLQRLITGLERDQIKGFLFPTVIDPTSGKDLYDFSLISPTGDRASTLNTQDVIKQFNLEMMTALMTEVVLIGHEKQGSFALRQSAAAMLSFGLAAILDGIFDVINRDIIPPLWRLNAFPMDLMSMATHGDVESLSMDELGNFVLHLAQAGMDVRDLESEVRRRTGFPPPPNRDLAPETAGPEGREEDDPTRVVLGRGLARAGVTAGGTV